MKSYGFPSSFLQELKQKNDLVTIASRYLTLDRKGKTYWARCPFHGEKTPSFAVNEIDQYYHCFGCKASGDVITFVKEMESIDYVEAIKLLAEWANIEVPNLREYDDQDLKRRKAEKDSLTQCMRAATDFYRQQLHSREALAARDYLIRRKINADLIEKFEIGYSPNYTAIIDYLKKKGFALETQVLAGIVKEKDGRHYDALGERVIFPTTNVYGEVIAFTGRTLKQKVEYAKYINTAETPIFTKGKNLYAINLVKKRKQSGPINEIIIVEGQIDAISLHNAGFETTVASMGTALTKDQAKLLKRFCSKVFICYDGDFAGQSATLRGLDILREEGIDVRIMSLPNGVDPDDFIKTNGGQAFEKYMQKALPLIEFKLTYLLSNFNMEEIDGKARYTEAALEVLKELQSEIESEAYIEFIQKHTGNSKDFLRKKLYSDKLEQIIDTSKEDEKNMPIKTTPKHEGPFKDAETCVIANIFRKQRYAKPSTKIIDWLDLEYREIYEFIINNSPTAQVLIDKFSEEKNEIIGGIVNYNFLEDERYNKQLFDDCLWLIYRTYLTSQQGEKLEKIKEDPKNRSKYMKEMYEITQKLKDRKVEL